MHLSPGTRLGPYEIAIAIGAGGMGEVYRAQDTRLGRTVAIKVLSHSRTADPERKRGLLQEARAISALNHPNIVMLHDIASEGGVDYLVMEYVPGESLDRLIPPKGLPIAEALDHGIQIAEALAAAHAAGIVHRDIKPANVIVRPGGHVKVLDFGVAKLLDPGTSPLEDKTRTLNSLTGPGVVIGTLGYMSPEQVRGDVVDQRSDIFSLGCVLYEMLAGTPPFARSAAVFGFQQAGLSGTGALNPALPRQEPGAALPVCREARIRLKNSFALLAPDAPKRIRHFSRRTVMASAGVAAIGATALGAYMRFGRAHSFESLAVLPLANATGDPGNDYLSEGISQSIINRLSQTSLRVTAFSTAAQIKDKAPNPITAGRQLNVAAVMTGRVSRQGSNVVIQTELVNTADGTQIWGEKFVRPVSEIQVFEEEIAKNIAQALQLRLTQTEKTKFSKHDTVSVEAYKLYLQGQFYWNKKTEEGFHKAIEYFNQAIASDPKYALAYAGLAHAYANLGTDSYLPQTDVMPPAQAAAKKALALDDALADGHTALAMYHIFYSWDWPGGHAELQRAMALDPNGSDPLHFYGHYLEIVGRTDEAIAVMGKALELDPLSLTVNTEYGFALYCAHRFAEAFQALRKTLEMDRSFSFASWIMAQALERMGRYEDAIAELERVGAPGGRPIMIELACAHAAAGRLQEARRIMAEQLEKREFIDAGLIALVYAELHDPEETFRWLEKAYNERSPLIVFLKTEPKFDRLRSDPRFLNLLRRLKLV